MRQRYGDVDEIEVEREVAAGPAEPGPPPARRVLMGIVVVVCVAVTVVHLLLVFLHVAPANPISQRLSRPVNAWIYPFFEQNWQLFAPNPQSAETEFFARTGWTTASGDRQTSDWFDIGTEDLNDIRHDPYPSHVSQNMLRRAWGAYEDTHDDDDVSHSSMALIRAKYLRNIAVQRAVAHSPHPFQVIRLKVVRLPIPPPSTGGTTPADAPDPVTRILPWWNVAVDGN